MYIQLIEIDRNKETTLYVGSRKLDMKGQLTKSRFRGWNFPWDCKIKENFTNEVEERKAASLS